LAYDAYALAHSSHSALHRIADIQFTANLADVNRAALLGEVEIAHDSKEFADARPGWQ
jgi:hypothetical protein